MSDHQAGQPFSESNLDSPEYRERLQRKLDYLITVLELAIGKVHRNLSGPAPDTERLLRIRKNLQDTLDVCLRARTALERREKLPDSLPSSLAQAVQGPEAPTFGAGATRGARVEMSSDEEHRRFLRLGKIDAEQIRACDFDELARKLQH